MKSPARGFPSLALKIVEEAKNLTKYSHIATIQDTTMRTAIRLSVPNSQAEAFLKSGFENDKNLRRI
jgi:hypothetical protein